MYYEWFNLIWPTSAVPIGAASILDAYTSTPTDCYTYQSH